MARMHMLSKANNKVKVSKCVSCGKETMASLFCYGETREQCENKYYELKVGR